MTGCVQTISRIDDAELPKAPDAWSTITEAQDPSPWLASFEDPQLSALIEEALAGNFSLQAALARVEQATAVARIQGADRWPGLSAYGAAQRVMSNNLQDPPARSRSDRFELGLTTSWELDLWGRVRATTLSANASAEASLFDYQSFRLSLAARVAQAWYTAKEARSQTALALDTLNSYEANLATVEERFERGISPALDLRLTRANVASARANYALQKRRADSAIRQLEVLVGRYPTGELAVTGEFPVVANTPSAGLPTALLDRRPDVQAAWQRVVAADASLISSKRALLPAISLSASYGSASGDLDNLLKDNFDVWNLVGNMGAPIFQGGRLRANIDRNSAALSETLHTYHDVVLNSFREVETALANEDFLREQLTAVRLSVEESLGALKLAEERYERGISDILIVLEAQRRSFNNQSNLILIQNEQLQNRLNLVLALGGEI